MIAACPGKPTLRQPLGCSVCLLYTRTRAHAFARLLRTSSVADNQCQSEVSFQASAPISPVPIRTLRALERGGRRGRGQFPFAGSPEVAHQAFAYWGRGLGVTACPGEGISVGSTPTCQSAQ